MRNISFSMTTQAFKDHRKTVTRRIGWAEVKPGDVLMGIEKGQGLKKGERVVRLGKICVVGARWEPLDCIDQADVIREGFPGMTPEQFIQMFCKHNKWEPGKDVRRIEFEYL